MLSSFLKCACQSAETSFSRHSQGFLWGEGGGGGE